MSEKFLTVRIRAEVADFRKQMQEASKVTQDVGKTATETASKSTGALGQMVQSAQRHEQAWSTSGAALLGFGAAVSVGVGLAIKSYMDFDKAMSEVKAATHASAGDMELLRTAAIKAGADTSYSAKEAADAITELSKAGVSTKEILGGGLSGALSLAAAGSIEVADAAELAATAMTQFKLKGDQIPHLADLLAAGAGKAQGSVQDLGAALGQSGLVAASTGLSIEETTGGLAAFASAGLLGSDAGTSFKTMLQSLTPNSAAAATEMQRLGINAYDANGKFIGLSKFAGNLKDSMKGLSDEQRNASMKIIFGSDAVRAANVLYEQGAKGISDWTDKVNDAGYAATTAAIKQDNLAGDLEKVGGSLDSVFLKSGSGANEVLRGLAQGADKLIDSIGQLPAPLLQTGLGIAAVTGGAALLGGAFLTTFPKVLETRRAFNELAISNEKLHAGLSKTAKVASVATAAFVGLQIAGQIGNSLNGSTRSFEEMANKILEASKAGDQFGETFNQDFLKHANGNLLGEMQVGNLKDLFKASDQDDFNGFMNNVVKGMTGGYEFQVHRATKALSQADAVITGMAKNGNAKAAADNFRKFAEASGEAGLSQEKLFARFPEYRDALLGQARALGVSVGTGKDAISQEEFYQWALGNTPAKIKAVTDTSEGQAKAAEYQAKMTEEATKKLEDMGLRADGTVQSLSKLLDAMFATGLATMSARDAEAAYQESLDGLKVKIDEVMASQTAGNSVLDAATGSFDLTSEAGRGANAVFGELAQKAIATTQAMANNKATQAELGVKLGETYTSLYNTARAFGASEEKADDLARSALSIPKNVPIEVAIQNYADTIAKAQGVKQALDNINPVKTIFFQTDASGFYDPSAGTDGKGAGSGGGSKGPRAFANGGIVRAFADGGVVHAANGLNRQSMIAKGGANILWAEPETGWEAYISGRPGQEDRNRAILKEIAPRFGLETYAPSKSLAGGYGQVQSFSGFAGNASGTNQPAAVNGTFEGNLYLDSGEFLGKVRGVARQEAGAAVGAAGRDISRGRSI